MIVAAFRYRGHRIEVLRRRDTCGEYFDATLNGIPIVTLAMSPCAALALARLIVDSPETRLAIGR